MTDDSNKKKEDKILNNNYVKGNIESENLPDPKPESEYEQEHLANYYDAETYEHLKQLSEKIYALYMKSKWASHDINKRFPKDTLSPLYVHFRKNLDNQGYTSLDIFLATADFLATDTDKLYELIPLKYKGEVQSDLKEKYSKITNTGKNLF